MFAIALIKSSDKEIHGGPPYKQIDVETNLGQSSGYLASANSIRTR